MESQKSTGYEEVYNMMREPAAAGTFYELDRQGLVRSIEQCFTGEFGPGRLPSTKEPRTANVVGLVSPHAGYVYSGGGAAYAYDRLAGDGLPETVVLLGPNHHGLGPAVAVSSGVEWRTPLGAMQIDLDTADAILADSEFAQRNDTAHAREHSIEVQLPFLQYMGGDKVKIVPICIAHVSESDAVSLASDLGAAIGKALASKSAVVIASTDFTHYEPKAAAEKKDKAAIGKILELDGEGLIREVYGRSITMCGVVGTAVALEACKALGATKAHELTYYTSGDVIGDTSRVVGYGALSIEK